MASLNKVILIGNLGKDPEVISFDNGTKKMTVSLATTERYRDRDGNWQEQTEWHNLVSWGPLAQDIADKRRNYVKGDQMYVEGRIKSRQFVDNQNVTRHITEIVVDKMMSLSGNRTFFCPKRILLYMLSLNKILSCETTPNKDNKLPI